MGKKKKRDQGLKRNCVSNRNQCFSNHYFFKALYLLAVVTFVGGVYWDIWNYIAISVFENIHVDSSIFIQYFKCFKMKTRQNLWYSFFTSFLWEKTKKKKKLWWRDTRYILLFVCHHKMSRYIMSWWEANLYRNLCWWPSHMNWS